jgi:ribosomal protein L27
MVVFDVGGKKFDEAPAGSVAGVRDEHRHYLGVARGGERAGRDDCGKLIVHPRGFRKLPGGTPPKPDVR